MKTAKKKVLEEIIEKIESKKQYKDLIDALKGTEKDFKITPIIYHKPTIIDKENGRRYKWLKPHNLNSITSTAASSTPSSSSDSIPHEQVDKPISDRPAKKMSFADRISQPNRHTITLDDAFVVQSGKFPFYDFVRFTDSAHNVFTKKDEFVNFLSGNYQSIDLQSMSKILRLLELYVKEAENIKNEKKESEERERVLNSTNPESRSQQLLNLYPSNAIWKQKDAAALVGMSTRTLYKRMQEGLFKTHKSKVYIKSFLEYLYKNEPQYFNNALERDL